HNTSHQEPTTTDIHAFPVLLPDPRPGRTAPDGTRHFDTNNDGETYGETILGNPHSNPYAFTNLSREHRNALSNYSGNSDLHNGILRARTLHKKLEVVETPALRGPLWPLYEMTGLTPLTLGHIARAHHDGTHHLTPEQAHLVTHIMTAPDPAQALHNLKQQSGKTAYLIETHGTFPHLAGLEHEISLIDQAIAANPLPEPLTAHRYMFGIDFMEGFTPGDPTALEGTVQTDPGYLSTSLGARVTRPKAAQHPFYLHLTLPPGTTALWLGSNSAYPRERELLLPRGSRYQITKVTRESHTVRLDAELLLPRGQNHATTPHTPGLPTETDWTVEAAFLPQAATDGGTTTSPTPDGLRTRARTLHDEA
ncbi:ADP-ribosyltransferase, partial [Nocardiopsis sp. LOL_012]|uniref:ADP-ribosyltransferase n=1 Tax=Nocardiopsis sp. LOL_012 TaxID=3345409 RepID=UPI003A8B2FBA